MQKAVLMDRMDRMDRTDTVDRMDTVDTSSLSRSTLEGARLLPLSGLA